MYTTRTYNENYYTSRKKILTDFLKDEEAENMKYIEETESLVSQTKLFLKNLINGEIDFDQLNDQLEDIQTELEEDCKMMQGEINTGTIVDNQIEKQTQEISKQEEAGTKEYMQRIEDLKNEGESKEFTIQNMERLYIDGENIIKDNIAKGNDQGLTMEQFNEYISQNNKLKKEIKIGEDEKNKLNDDYNNGLKDNLYLRSKDESFELEKIKNAGCEVSPTVQKESEIKIQNLQSKYKKLNDESTELSNKIKKLTTTLQAINVNNDRFNNELNMINEHINHQLNHKSESKQDKGVKRHNSFTKVIGEVEQRNIMDKLRNRIMKKSGVTNLI